VLTYVPLERVRHLSGYRSGGRPIFMHQDLPIRRHVHKEVLIVELHEEDEDREVRPSSRYHLVRQGSFALVGWQMEH
jgi:hypothetical protein